MRWSSSPLSYFPEHFRFEKEMDFQVESKGAVQLSELGERGVTAMHNSLVSSLSNIPSASAPHPHCVSQAGIITGLDSSDLPPPPSVNHKPFSYNQWSVFRSTRQYNLLHEAADCYL